MHQRSTQASDFHPVDELIICAAAGGSASIVRKQSNTHHIHLRLGGGISNLGLPNDGRA